MKTADDLAYSRCLVALFKGVVFKEKDPKHWETILSHKYKIEDYVSKLGLTLTVDEIDGYSYLKQNAYEGSDDEIPRLVPRHALSYHVSLLLVLLRKRLLEFDSASGDQRLILSREQIAESMRIFLKDTTDEAKLAANIDGYIDKAEKMGFLRKLQGSEGNFEVLRILRSFVNAEWLGNLDSMLESYRTYAEGKEGESESGRV